MVIGLACKAYGNGPEGRLGGFFKPPPQILTESLVAGGFFGHVKDGGFRFLGERGPFLSRETPVGDDEVFSSEDSVFLMHFLNCLNDFHVVLTGHGFLKCHRFLSLCFTQFVGVHTLCLQVPIGFCYASQSFFKPYGHNFE